MTSKTLPAHAAYEAYCIEHKRQPNDDERFAFAMGWYDGRIALQCEHNTQRAADLKDMFGHHYAGARRMKTNKETPPADVGGVCYVRRAKGRKLHFVVGGLTYAEATKSVRENDGWVALWQPFNDSRMFYIFPDGLRDSFTCAKPDTSPDSL